MTAGKNMYEVLWDRMDEVLNEYLLKHAVYTPSVIAPWAESRELAGLVGEMKGLAFAIQSWSAPFLQGEKAISKLAMERYRAIGAGRQMPDTPGVAGYNPLPPGAVRATIKANLSEMTVSQIIKGLDAGFPAADMASLYKVELSVVEAIRKGAV